MIDKNDHYLLFKINKVENRLPDLNSDKFIKQINLELTNKFKYEYNKKLLEEIQTNTLEYGDLKKFDKSQKIENRLEICNFSKTCKKVTNPIEKWRKKFF